MHSVALCAAATSGETNFFDVAFDFLEGMQLGKSTAADFGKIVDLVLLQPVLQLLDRPGHRFVAVKKDSGADSSRTGSGA